MTCTAVNHVHRRAVRFDIKVPDDEENGDFTYRASGNAHLLPEYMQVGGGFKAFECLSTSAGGVRPACKDSGPGWTAVVPYVRV